MPSSSQPTAGQPAAAPDQLTVFVDARLVRVPLGASVLDALQAADATLAEDVAHGARLVTDNRGLPIATAVPLHGGAILRTYPARGAAEDLDESER